MHSPIPHDLTIYDDKFDFENNGFCPHQWEISVPQRRCIIWSVVLSYLRSADLTVSGKFEERLLRITEQVFDPESVKAAILGFNPFFNIHKCFFDETLQKVGLSFSKLLKDSYPSTVKRTVPQDMQMISTLLKSNILIVDLSNQNLHLITPSNGYSADVAAITLFCREYLSNEEKQVVTKRFTFSLNKELCWELRRNAFEIILESTELRGIAEKEMQPLTEKKEKRVNILITLLKKDLTNEISDLYDSPYTMAKLADAGFETDPRVWDEHGFSAFYYALQSRDNNLVYLLYKYAANSCYEFENTFRDPNLSIISNFSKLKEILNGDCARSNNFEECGDRAEQARLNYGDLLKFGEFLTEVSDGIIRIREKIPKGSSIEVAAKLKDIILLILETYVSERFFTVGLLKLGLNENYTKHKTYYDNLDFTVALLFFDNIFLLKSVMKSPRERFYSDLESSFLLSAVTNKYFTKRIIKDKMQDLGFELDSINLSTIPLLERVNLRENIRNFCSILKEQTLEKGDIVSRIPPQEITEMLSNFQELKDEFLIFRLKHYLRTALETESGGLKKKLAIQRALQVIGDCINVEKEEGPSSIRHLLRKYLPEDTLKVLKKVGNTLSYLESYQFPLKFKIEQDDDLFRSIQSELTVINEALQEVFDAQKIWLMEFLINRGLELLRNIQQTSDHAVFHEDYLMRSMEHFKEALRAKSSEFQYVSGKKEIDEHREFVPGILEFSRRLMGFVRRSEEKQIRREIPLEVKTRVNAAKSIEQDLTRGINVDLERFDCLFLKEKDLRNIKKDYEKFVEAEDRYSLLHKIRKSPNPVNVLDLIFQKSKVSDSQLKFLYETIHFSEESKATINSLSRISKRTSGDNLANLLNRIKHLYQITIDERYDIRFLWERAKSSKAKQYLVYKIVQRYLHESSFQASMEMLLFDCVAILKNNQDFNSFWLKNSYLFNGIDVGNVLAHGDTHLESIGDILDPMDLPSELVQKMLQLFEDRGCIEALCDLQRKMKRSDTISKYYPECQALKERIVPCGRWQSYCRLLAKDPKDSETVYGIVSFLEKSFETKWKKGKKVSSPVEVGKAIANY